MKKIACALSLFFLLTSAYADSEKKLGKFSLGIKDSEFSVSNAAIIDGKDEICVVGNYLDDEGAKIYGRIMLLSFSQEKVLWQKKIRARDDNVNSSFVSCVRQGNFIYVAANEDTDSHRETNQTLVYIYKFDLHGAQLAAKRIDVPGRSELAYGLSEADGELLVVGLMKDADEKNEYYSTFTSKFNENLKFQTVIMKNGGFSRGAAFKFSNGNLFIGGEFYPHSILKNEPINDYANSRIRLGSGYTWSVRPQRAPSSNITTMVSEFGDLYSLGYEKSTTFFSVINSNGKILSKVEYPSKFCKTKSMAKFNDYIFAIRMPCGDPVGRAVAVLIDDKTGREKELSIFKEEPVYIFSNDFSWYAISKDKGGRLSFQSGRFMEVSK